MRTAGTAGLQELGCEEAGGEAGARGSWGACRLGGCILGACSLGHGWLGNSPWHQGSKGAHGAKVELHGAGTRLVPSRGNDLRLLGIYAPDTMGRTSHT